LVLASHFHRLGCWRSPFVPELCGPACLLPGSHRRLGLFSSGRRRLNPSTSLWDSVRRAARASRDDCRLSMQPQSIATPTVSRDQAGTGLLHATNSGGLARTSRHGGRRSRSLAASVLTATRTAPYQNMRGPWRLAPPQGRSNEAPKLLAPKVLGDGSDITSRPSSRLISFALSSAASAVRLGP
jgi:hypothetical protein